VTIQLHNQCALGAPYVGSSMTSLYVPCPCKLCSPHYRDKESMKNGGKHYDKRVTPPGRMLSSITHCRKPENWSEFPDARGIKPQQHDHWPMDYKKSSKASLATGTSTPRYTSKKGSISFVVVIFDGIISKKNVRTTFLLPFLSVDDPKSI
jgi:hypothetical protein